MKRLDIIKKRNLIAYASLRSMRNGNLLPLKPTDIPKDEKTIKPDMSVMVGSQYF